MSTCPIPKPGVPDPDVVFCPLDPSPLPLRYRVEGDVAHYAGDYQQRARRPGSDVDICFRGQIAVSLIRLICRPRSHEQPDLPRGNSGEGLASGPLTLSNGENILILGPGRSLIRIFHATREPWGLLEEGESMRRWCVLTLCVSGMVSAGCREPEDFVPALPPGAVVAHHSEVEPLDEAPQAIGEDRSVQAQVADVKPAPPTEKGQKVTTATGLQYETLKPGDGPEVKSGQSVTVNYRGTLENGKEFDQHDKLVFFLGRGTVIKGWEQGVAGMKIGERRKLIVPPNLGYGDVAKGEIPPNSTLIFEIEVLKAR